MYLHQRNKIDQETVNHYPKTLTYFYVSITILQFIIPHLTTSPTLTLNFLSLSLSDGMPSFPPVWYVTAFVVGPPPPPPPCNCSSSRNLHSNSKQGQFWFRHQKSTLHKHQHFEDSVRWNFILLRILLRVRSAQVQLQQLHSWKSTRHHSLRQDRSSTTTPSSSISRDLATSKCARK